MECLWLTYKTISHIYTTRLSEPIDTLLKGIHRVGWVLSVDIQPEGIFQAFSPLTFWNSIDNIGALATLGFDKLKELKHIGETMMSISEKLQQDNFIEVIINIIKENKDNILNAIFNQDTFRDISYNINEASNYSEVISQQLNFALETMLMNNCSATLTVYAQNIHKLTKVSNNLCLDLIKLIKQQK